MLSRTQVLFILAIIGAASARLHGQGALRASVGQGNEQKVGGPHCCKVVLQKGHALYKGTAGRAPSTGYCQSFEKVQCHTLTERNTKNGGAELHFSSEADMAKCKEGVITWCTLPSQGVTEDYLSTSYENFLMCPSGKMPTLAQKPAKEECTKSEWDSANKRRPLQECVDPLDVSTSNCLDDCVGKLCMYKRSKKDETEFLIRYSRYGGSKKKYKDDGTCDPLKKF